MECFNVAIQSITAVFVAFIGLSWYSQERIRRKMERYEKLTEYLSSFYEPSGCNPESSDEEKKINKKEIYLNRQEFMKQYRLAFMYCPDEVIEKLNFFIDYLQTDPIEAKKSVGELIIAIRNDIYNNSRLKIPSIKIFYFNKSKLSSEDFKHVGINF